MASPVSVTHQFLRGISPKCRFNPTQPGISAASEGLMYSTPGHLLRRLPRLGPGFEGKNTCFVRVDGVT